MRREGAGMAEAKSSVWMAMRGIVRQRPLEWRKVLWI
jgi:hypothetical protein